MGNKKSKPNKNNNKNNSINSNITNNSNNSINIFNSNNTINVNNVINSSNFPKLKLNKFFDNVSSIYYCFELIDGRLFLCICGYSFDIYNINQLDKNKKELEINPGIYTVSSTQLHTGIIVICTYGQDMKFFSIENNEVKEIQTITAEDDRENFVSELSNGQLITMNWYGRIKLYDLKNGLYEEVKCFQPFQSFNASKMKEIEENIIVIRGWNISNEESKDPLYLCYLNTQKIKLIKETCIDFDIMTNKNIIIFNKYSIDIFSFKTLQIIKSISIEINLKSACLYNDNTLLIGSEKVLTVFKMNANELIELQKINVDLNDDHYISQIIKLKKNNSIVIIGNTELILYSLINN